MMYMHQVRSLQKPTSKETAMLWLPFPYRFQRYANGWIRCDVVLRGWACLYLGADMRGNICSWVHACARTMRCKTDQLNTLQTGKKTLPYGILPGTHSHPVHLMHQLQPYPPLWGYWISKNHFLHFLFSSVLFESSAFLLLCCLLVDYWSGGGCYFLQPRWRKWK